LCLPPPLTHSTAVTRPSHRLHGLPSKWDTKSSVQKAMQRTAECAALLSINTANTCVQYMYNL
jgi:hypothetical protein